MNSVNLKYEIVLNTYGSTQGLLNLYLRFVVDPLSIILPSLSNMFEIRRHGFIFWSFGPNFSSILIDLHALKRSNVEKSFMKHVFLNF